MLHCGPLVRTASSTQVLHGLGTRDRAAVHAERKETRHKADQVVHLRSAFPPTGF